MSKDKVPTRGGLMAQGKDYYLARMTRVNTETAKRGDSSVQTLYRDHVCMCSAFTIL